MQKSFASAFAAASAAGALLAGCALIDPSMKPAEPAARPAAERPAPIPLSQLMKKPGGFYNDDAPDGAPPVDLDRLADAVPVAEPMNWRANEPYTVYGREYVPYKAAVEYRRQGTISWYGRKFHGQRTWSGEIYDMYGMTAAHPTLPIPSYVRIVNLENRKAVVVRVNDRGPFLSGRIMDISYAAAHRLGFAQSGTATAEIEAILPGVAQAAKPSPKPAASEPAELEASFATTADAPGIFLQLGAFGAPQNAESFRSKVQPQLAEEKLTAQIIERQKLFRVQVGPFRNRQEAAQTAEKLREPLGIRPIVVLR